MAIRLAVFDLDGTLLVGSKTVMPALVAHIWQTGFRRPQGLFRLGLAGLAGVGRKLRLLSREQYTEYGTRLILGWLAGLRPEEAAPFFRESTRRLLIAARPSTTGEIGARQQEGYRTVILSATIQPFLEEIARHLNCDAVGTPIALTADGRITGGLAGPYCSGSGKLTTLKRWAEGLEEPVDWEASIAYADTLPDLPVLEAVGTAVVVAPEPALHAIAIERGWRLMDV